MKDLMLDIETLGIRPTSVITQIGACYFDRTTGKVGLTFCKNIDVADSLMNGLTIDEETVGWWRSQENKSWMIDALSIVSGLVEFNKFCSRKIEAVWSHATFDIPILLNAYDIIEVKKPFHYRVCRDIRTLVDLSDSKKRNDHKTRKTHNALDDCIYQVEYCTECLNKLRSK